MLLSEARSRGYSPEILALAVDMTFTALLIDTVWVQYHPANTAAGRLCDRLGFESYADGALDTNSVIVRCVHRSTWYHTDASNNT